MKLKTILLVDDNNSDVEMTLRGLKTLNLANRVTVASDGVEAIDFLNCKGKFTDRIQGNPGVILLDIKMPRMDGIEVLKIIRSHPVFKLIPVVMLTSSKEDPDLKKAYELGVNAYVVKPVDFTQFVEAVARIGSFWAVINELPPENI